MMVRLHIQFMSKPELTFDEMVTFLLTHFPFLDEGESVIGVGNPYNGSVRITLKQERLTLKQRDWLNNSTFSARYIDSYQPEYDGLNEANPKESASLSHEKEKGNHDDHP